MPAKEDTERNRPDMRRGGIKATRPVSARNEARAAILELMGNMTAMPPKDEPPIDSTDLVKVLIKYLSRNRSKYG